MRGGAEDATEWMSGSGGMERQRGEGGGRGKSGILGGLESRFNAPTLSWTGFPQLCLGGLPCFLNTQASQDREGGEEGRTSNRVGEDGWGQGVANLHLLESVNYF